MVHVFKPLRLYSYLVFVKFEQAIISETIYIYHYIPDLFSV